VSPTLNTRAVRILVSAAALIALAVAAIDTQSASAGDGGWVTYSNGNEVWALGLEGDLVWAATYGGAVVWDTSPVLAYRKFYPSDGLASNSVRCVSLDPSGLEWFGTGDGLSVLDDNGTPLDPADDSWSTFTEADGLGYRSVVDIAVGGSGHKWMGTFGGGVSLLDDGGTPFDKADDAWQTFTTSDGLGSDYVTGVVIDGGGNVWFATYGGVSVLDHNGTPLNKSDDVWQTFTVSDGLATNILRDIAIGGTGLKWIACAGGITGGVSVLDDNGTPFNKGDDTWQNFTTADGLASNEVRALALESGKVKWFATDAGVSVLCDEATPFNKTDDHWRTFTVTDGLGDDDVRDVIVGGADVWFATRSGVCVLDDNGTPLNKGDDSWQTLLTEDWLPANYVEEIAIDAGGNKWFATLGGAAVLDDNGTPFNHNDDRWQTFTVGDGLASDYVTGVAVGRTGYVWFTTNGGASVLNHNRTPFEKSDDTWQTFTTKDGLPDNFVYTLSIDDAGLKWFGTLGGGIWLLSDNGTPLNKADDTSHVFDTSGSGLADDCVNAMAFDGAGFRWFCTDGGVSVLDDGGTPLNGGDDSWQTFTSADGLVSDYVFAVAIDPAGYKWFGTEEPGGVNVLHDNGTPLEAADDQWETFTTADGLASGWLRAIRTEGANEKRFGVSGTWAGGGGLSVLDDGGTPLSKSDDTWANYSTTDGLASNGVNAMAVEGPFRWFGTPHGVSEFVEYTIVFPLGMKQG
jgi:ligand-binding sensor domain-containing protein